MQPKISKDRDAERTAHARQERISWMETRDGWVIDQLLTELEPRCAQVRRSAIQIVCEGRASRGAKSVGDDAEDAICHGGSILRLLSCIVLQVIERIGIWVIEKIVDKDHVGLFGKDGTVHIEVLLNDTSIGINRDGDLTRYVRPRLIWLHSKVLSKLVRAIQMCSDESHRVSDIVFIICKFVRIGGIKKIVLLRRLVPFEQVDI